MCHFGIQNDPFLLNKMFLVQTTIITFIYLLAFFIVQNLKKFLQSIQNYEDSPFFVRKWSICPIQFFFFENFQNHFYLPISPFHWAKFKKNSSSGYTVLRMCNFWTQNCLFPQMSCFFFFFRKPANESCFCHSCLTSCQKSKSDINLLVKY